MSRHAHFTPSTYTSDSSHNGNANHHCDSYNRPAYHTNPTPVFYDNPEGGFLKRDSHRPPHYPSVRDPHSTQVYYDNPEGGFITADSTLPPPNNAHMYTTHYIPLLGHAHPRPHPYTPSQPLQDLGFGPTPLFGWGSVTPLTGGHTYGQPKYLRYQKPDHRRFCYSVGKADVPYASLPGGPLWGYPAHMAEQLVRR
ncbi:hypothetical protein I350_07984 [Cryptococcus amylolentus CBS 6273]|nr:hypothetical protein I350_07984 [Cryptococcus amylolentus CBS 6273]